MTVEYTMTTRKTFKSKEECIEYLKKLSTKNFMPINFYFLETNNKSVFTTAEATTTTIIRE